MKLRIKEKLMSVLSEVQVTDARGEVLYYTDTEPLSSPRLSHFKDAHDQELAKISTVRLDEKKRAHHVVMADGRVYDLTRKFRNPASTTESIVTVENVGWCAVTRRAWTSRFEIRSEDGTVLAEAKQIAAERGNTYDLDVKCKENVMEVVLFALIVRYTICQDAPVLG